ncbi:hypothetical protein XENOCAPTIV_027539 [Xenoophorus captivus]|uniref:Uncharacterized protein n=1 Tax=Xenoophorus captivus TaxID=1517983 RepID=A0ABV0QC96_9TELE
MKVQNKRLRWQPWLQESGKHRITIPCKNICTPSTFFLQPQIALNFTGKHQHKVAENWKENDESEKCGLHLYLSTFTLTPLDKIHDKRTYQREVQSRPVLQSNLNFLAKRLNCSSQAL